MTIRNGDMPAMPSDSGDLYRAITEEKGGWRKAALGLTKREQFAMAAMQGFAANGGYATPSDAAHDSVKWADALLAELDKDGGE